MDNSYQDEEGGGEGGGRKNTNFILSEIPLVNCPLFFLFNIIIYLSCFCIFKKKTPFVTVGIHIFLYMK